MNLLKRVAPFLLLYILLATAVFLGHWRGTSAHPPVAVPMFYDAHYLYPRPWTQAQAAPSTPGWYPISALYGQNRVSQPLKIGADGFSVLKFDLVGNGRPFQLTLAAGDGQTWWATIATNAGEAQTVRLRLPQPQPAGDYLLTLYAPQATADAPLTLFGTGGDRLGGSIRLNEYRRPANLAIATYATGYAQVLPALREQFLPALFQTRLSQYKVAPLKGGFIGWLALGVAGASLALWLLLPAGQMAARVSRWRQTAVLLHVAMALFLGWQLLAGRLFFPFASILLESVDAPIAIAPPPDPQAWRVADDLALTAWTASRQPEVRWLGYTAAGLSVPAPYTITQTIVTPSQSRLVAGFEAIAPATAVLLLDGVPLVEQYRTVRQNLAISQTLPAGRAVQVALATRPEGALLAKDTAVGVWQRPLVEVRQTWLRPYERSEPLFSFVSPAARGSIELLGVALDETSYAAGETAVVRLEWHAAVPTDAYPTFFVHLLNEAGEIVAQRDSAAVGGAYPVANWQANAVIVDEHPLRLPVGLPSGRYRLAVGVYEPSDLVRWATSAPENRAVLPVSLVVGE